MHGHRLSPVLLAATAVAVILAAPAGATSDASRATAAVPKLYAKCANLNAKYPHGVGRAKARDRTTSGDPVTTFKRSTQLYKLAMSHNKGLDRDKDGIACEKK
jgi:hypothetical protein